MPAKEPKQVVGVADAQVKALNAEIKALKEELEHIKNLLEDRYVDIESLEQENAHMLEKLTEQPEPLEAIWSDADLVDDTRTDMLMAMLPQVRIEFAHHDAQRAEKAVDDIMKVWGLSDD